MKIRHFSLPSGSKTRGVGVFDPQVDFRFLDSCLSFGVDHSGSSENHGDGYTQAGCSMYIGLHLVHLVHLYGKYAVHKI